MTDPVVSDNPKTIRKTLEALVPELAGVCEKHGLSRQREDLKGILANLREQKLNAVVVGEFNRGKSMFVNSLLGEEILPTGITPTMALISKVRYGTVRNMKAVYTDGFEKTILPEELEELRIDCDREISHVDIRLPNDILKRMTFIDTPGTNDPDETEPEVLYGHISKADVLIFVMGCDQAFTRNERIFLSQKILKNDYDKMLFVLNKSDIVRKPAELEILRERAEVFIGNWVEFPKLSVYSALLAMEGRIENNAAKREKSNFDSLRDLLSREFADRKDNLLLRSVHGKLAGTVSDIRRSLKIELDGRKKSAKRLAEEIKILAEQKTALRERLDALKSKYSGEFRTICEKFVLDVDEFGIRFAEAIPEQVEGVEADDIKRYLPFFIQDTLKRFLEEKEEEVRALITDTARGICEDIRREMSELSIRLDFAPEYFLVGGDNLDSFTVMDKIFLGVSFLGIGAMLFSLPAGALILLSGGIVNKTMRSKMEQKALPEIIEKSKTAITESAKSVGEKIAEVFDDLDKNLGEQIESFFKQTFEGIETTLSENLDKKRRAESGEDAEAEADTRHRLEKLGQMERTLEEICEKIRV